MTQPRNCRRHWYDDQALAVQQGKNMEIKDAFYAIGILLTFILGVWNLRFNFLNSKKARFINTVTSERVKWLEKLRQDLSSFCGLTYTWSASQMEGKPQEHEMVREIDRLRHLIRLRLNPRGLHDQNIESLMKNIIESTHPSKSAELKKYLDELTSEAQKMLKEEWEKVKLEAVKGELNDAKTANNQVNRGQG